MTLVSHIIMLFGCTPRAIANGAICKASAVNNYANVFDLLSYQLQSVDQCCRRDNGCAVLIIMEDRNLHGLLESLLDVETFRRLDVLKVNTAESRLQQLAGLDNLIRIFCVQFDIKDINVGKTLEKIPPSMTGLPAKAPRLPSPRTAVPFETTATRFPLAVYL
jgi:hypothetical protein